MKAEAVAGIAVVGAMLGAAVVAGRSSAASPSPGPAPGPSPSPAVPSATDIMTAGGIPPLSGAPGHVLVDTAPNGMVATAIYSTDSGGIVDLSNVNPMTGDYDALRVGLAKNAGQGFPALLVSKRGTKLFAKNVTLGGPSDIMDLVGAAFSQTSPTGMRLDKGPSHMNIFVGLRVTGDPSPNVTAVGYGDTRKPMTAAQSKVAPDMAYDIDRESQNAFGVKPLTG